MVTETTSRREFIPKAWLKSNATVIQMEAHSFEKDVILSADRIILDSWEQMTHLPGHVFQQMHDAGQISADRVHHIHELAIGALVARENDDEFIFCGTYGMGCLDLTIADKLYHNAVAMGLGTKLVQWDNPLWV